MKKILVAFGIFMFCSFKQNYTSNLKDKLSDYQFFIGNIADLKPAEGIKEYALNTPLFSDYAEKLRFIKIPEGKTANYNDKEVFDFPEGTTIIKNFYYPNDFRNPSKGRRIMETRLLILENETWKALEYIWNDEQTEAFLEVAGDTKVVSYIDKEGKRKKQEYSFPNLNQCKGCHNKNEVMIPIGLSARQLNGNLPNSMDNQLLTWQKLGILRNMPTIENIPKAVVWNDPTTGSVDERARIWLDINCAHCHRPEGPANTSGLNLSIHNEDKTTLGFNKTPVAAGRASQNRSADIVPGHPEDSILLLRLESTDPGIMMPEIGRKTAHKESIELIKQWIKTM